MSLYFPETTAIITIATDDDLSAAADLGSICDFMRIVIPTQTSANLSFQVSNDNSTFYSLANGATIAAGTGNYATTIKLGGWHYVKVATSAAQAANRTYTLQGWRI